MKRIRAWIKSFFGFSTGETNGFLILLPLCGLLIFAEPIYRAWFTSQPQDYAHDKIMLDSLVSHWQFTPPKDIAENLNTEPKRFNFDPNTITVDGLKELGFEPWVANRIVTYRSKGGKFKIKNDLKKIYGIDTALVAELYPYITLPELNLNRANNQFSRTQSLREKKTLAQAPIFFDINAADTTQLIQLKGIGSKLSQRLIKYRDKLGGFVSQRQFSEVFGLDSLAVEELNKCTFVSQNFVPRQININKATERQLTSLPYIKFPVAKAMVAYRYQHKNFTSVDELKNIAIVDESTFQKIKPYLTVTD